MDVLVRYFDDCPSWTVAVDHLERALGAAGCAGVTIRLEQVTTVEQAEAVGFTGSPTILVDGVDPFADATATPALACRVYQTPEGLRGAPTVDQLVAVLTGAR